MTTEAADDLDLTAGARTTAAEEAKGISLLRKAAETRADRSDAAFIDVPSWAGDLIAEYQVVDRQRLEQLVRKIQQEMKSGSNTAARTAADLDLIIAANVGLYAYDAEGGEEEEDRRVPIEDELGTVTYGRFGEILLQIRPPKDGQAPPKLDSVRSIVLYAFKNNNTAISAHALQIARWMRDPSKPVTEPELG